MSKTTKEFLKRFADLTNKKLEYHPTTMTDTTTKTMFIVTAPSAVHLGRCLLGYGETKAKAIANAFGGRPRKSQIYSVDEIPQDEFYDKWYRWLVKN